MGQKVVTRFWWESGLSSAYRNHLTTFCRPFVHCACLKSVFHDSPLYPKHLSLFCVLWLISACADRIGYIANFCSMIELSHEFKNSSCWHRSIQGFGNFSAGKKENYKFAGLLYTTKKQNFCCVL